VNLFLTSAQLATIDVNNGAATLRGQSLSSWLGYPQNLVIMGMVFTPDGRLLGGAMPPPSPTSIYMLDPSIGQPTFLGWSATAGELMSFAYDPTQGVLYAASPSTLYTIDPTKGASTYVSTFSGNRGPIMGLAIDDNGAMYAADFTSSSKIYSVDRTTGVATQLFDTGTSHIHNIAFNPRFSVSAADHITRPDRCLSSS
jgi:DNA-binding beta-propeller fold protein YncE